MDESHKSAGPQTIVLTGPPPLHGGPGFYNYHARLCPDDTNQKHLLLTIIIITYNATLPTTQRLVKISLKILN